MRRNPLVNNYSLVAEGDVERSRQMMVQGRRVKSGCNFLSVDASMDGLNDVRFRYDEVNGRVYHHMTFYPLHAKKC